MADKLGLFMRTKSMAELKQTNPVAIALFIVVVALGVVASALTGQFGRGAAPFWMLGSFLPALYLLFSLKIASQWEKAVVLHFGKFKRLAGPGLFWIVPIVETIPSWVDQRVMVTSFSAEKTLTNDLTRPDAPPGRFRTGNQASAAPCRLSGR